MWNLPPSHLIDWSQLFHFLGQQEVGQGKKKAERQKQQQQRQHGNTTTQPLAVPGAFGGAGIRANSDCKTHATMDKQFFQLVIVALTAQGLEINTSNNKFVEKAVGENVKLDCFFTTGPEDEGMLEIEWSVKSVRHPMEMAGVLLYTAEHIYNNLYEHLKGRVYFDAQDPEKGDAAIHLSQLTQQDTGLYYCQVKKAPGIQRIKAVLRVLERSSKPKCYSTEEDGEFGKTKVLHCGSEEGAAPIWYRWSRLPPWEHLPSLAVLDQTAGTLTIPYFSESDAGSYKCVAINRVGQEKCILEVNIPYSPSVEIIAGSVAGTVATIGIIAYVTYFTIRRRRRELENSNEIVEDASPPTPR
ncbi:Coxsackievirus and adenovirus receptor-like protein [Nibea albiflora]|uniref:Coxsackievirus and adenovirus receptor-like protein n=1 Tax=Nibea albiflora TaxID=240163 RepID=A0ACB7EG49_NIBAL|nr:Coxsackievirus and adenovirus receptor-like protein [Nibea albiflora]